MLNMTFWDYAWRVNKIVFSWKTGFLLLIFLEFRESQTKASGKYNFVLYILPKKALLASKMRSVTPVGCQPLWWAGWQTSTLCFSTNMHETKSHKIVSHQPSTLPGCFVLVFGVTVETSALQACPVFMHWWVDLIEYLNAVCFLVEWEQLKVKNVVQFILLTMWNTSRRMKIKPISGDCLFGTIKYRNIFYSSASL